MLPLIERCLDEHRPLLEQAGITHLARDTGWLTVYRSARSLEAGEAGRAVAAAHGLDFGVLDPAQVRALEPHLADGLVGGVHWRDPVSVSDPGAVTKGYAELFLRRGGRLVQADARSLQPAAGRLEPAGAGRPGAGARRGGGARAMVARPAAAARLPPAAGGQARLPHALPAARQCRAAPPGAGRRPGLSADPDGARRAPDHGDRNRPARRAADAGAAAGRRGRGADPVPAGQPGRRPSLGWARGPACPTCGR